MKTQVARYQALQRRIPELHPYQVCEVLALSVEAGLPAYLNWVMEQTSRQGGSASGA